MELLAERPEELLAERLEAPPEARLEERPGAPRVAQQGAQAVAEAAVGRPGETCFQTRNRLGERRRASRSGCLGRTWMPHRRRRS